MTLWLLLLAWILASFICAGLWAIAGLRLTRMQERNRFASDMPLGRLAMEAAPVSNSYPHADQLGTGPKERGIASVKVAGGRCDCTYLSHPDNPAGVQFYSPWQTQGWQP